MSLYDDLVKAEPSLIENNAFDKGLIVLRDDSDGQGAYIEKWDIDLPLPKGMKLGK